MRGEMPHWYGRGDLQTRYQTHTAEIHRSLKEDQRGESRCLYRILILYEKRNEIIQKILQDPEPFDRTFLQIFFGIYVTLRRWLELEDRGSMVRKHSDFFTSGLRTYNQKEKSIFTLILYTARRWKSTNSKFNRASQTSSSAKNLTR